MAGDHTLTVALDRGGISWAFECPHDGTASDALPDETRPPCRGDGDCAARTHLNTYGLSAAWAGPRTVLTAIPVTLVDHEGALLIERAPATAPGPDECARQLAHASGHPRYTTSDYGWRRLYEQDANVVHARREALKRGADKHTCDLWYGVLMAWHEHEAADDRIAQSAGAGPK